jgi:hypothetical protein
MPEELQRRLYDAFGLEIRYNPDGHQATIRITLSADTIDGVATTTRHTMETTSGESNNADPPQGEPALIA